MAIIELTDRSPRRAQVAWLVLSVLTAVVVVAALVAHNRTPQLGPDEEVFTNVDALFTAVTARDEKLLGQCEQRLHTLRDAGKLARGPAGYLDRVVQKARGGGWEAAAETLYDFMKAQRREGSDHPPKKKDRTNTRPNTRKGT